MPYRTKEAKQAYRDRNKEYMRKWRDENKEQRAEYNREYRLQSLYGITQSEWDALFAAQDNCCAICKGEDPGSKGWNTDHCHTTNKVRGILCQGCNLGLGNFKDNTTALAGAIEYLNTHNV